MVFPPFHENLVSPEQLSTVQFLPNTYVWCCISTHFLKCDKFSRNKNLATLDQSNHSFNAASHCQPYPATNTSLIVKVLEELITKKHSHASTSSEEWIRCIAKGVFSWNQSEKELLLGLRISSECSSGQLCRGAWGWCSVVAAGDKKT